MCVGGGKLIKFPFAPLVLVNVRGQNIVEGCSHQREISEEGSAFSHTELTGNIRLVLKFIPSGFAKSRYKQPMLKDYLILLRHWLPLELKIKIQKQKSESYSTTRADMSLYSNDLKAESAALSDNHAHKTETSALSTI